MIYGSISISNSEIDDFIISRSDGSPVYNFTNVIDDQSMKITHVVRGEDHISNTPKQILIYKAFNWEPPIFAHLPMILGEDKKRLSKRHGDSQGILEEIIQMLGNVDDWTANKLELIFKKYMENNGYGFGKVMKPVRLGLCGNLQGPSLFDIMEILGKELVIKRINYVINEI